MLHSQENRKFLSFYTLTQLRALSAFKGAVLMKLYTFTEKLEQLPKKTAPNLLSSGSSYFS